MHNLDTIAVITAIIFNLSDYNIIYIYNDGV